MKAMGAEGIGTFAPYAIKLVTNYFGENVVT